MTPALDLIRQFEGYRDTPYWDVNALRTGYGSDTVTLADGRVMPVTKDTRITRADAERDLLRRVQTEFVPIAVSAVGADVFQRFTPAQQAALASITYNYGELPDRVARVARTGDVAATAEAIRALGEDNGGVNRDRRAREAAIFAGQEALAGTAPRDRQDPAPERSPAQPNVTRLAMAYRNGQMTPEDAALFEQGMADGTFPQVKRKDDQPDPLASYEAVAMRRRAPIALAPLQASATNAIMKRGL